MPTRRSPTPTSTRATAIRAVLNGEDDTATSLIMVHGQDHLMNAITTIDFAARSSGSCASSMPRRASTVP